MPSAARAVTAVTPVRLRLTIMVPFPEVMLEFRHLVMAVPAAAAALPTQPPEAPRAVTALTAVTAGRSMLPITVVSQPFTLELLPSVMAAPAAVAAMQLQVQQNQKKSSGMPSAAMVVTAVTAPRSMLPITAQSLPWIISPRESQSEVCLVPKDLEELRPQRAKYKWTAWTVNRMVHPPM